MKLQLTLQKLQNFAAKGICGKSMRDHATPCLVYLHWLPVRFRIVSELIEGMLNVMDHG